MKAVGRSSLFVCLSFAVITGLILSACGSIPPTQPSPSDIAQSPLTRMTAPNVVSSDLEGLVAGNKAFAFDFYQAVRTQEGNLFYSPYSISLALAMTYAGARGGTANQMAETLNFTPPPDRLHPAFNALDLDLARRPEQAAEVGEAQCFQLHIVNSIWGQRGHPFLPEFLDLLAVNYGAGLRLVDFVSASENARLEINDWVDQQTKGKIMNLIPPDVINAATRLVLVNAIYFKAAWIFPFEEALTHDDAFILLDGNQVNVPMMRFPMPASLYYTRGDGYQALALPYKGNMAEMFILLPDEGRFEEFEASLTAERFDEILAGMQSESVVLTMPKFSFDSAYNLNRLLADLGMPDAFDPSRADFSGIDGARDLFIGAVLHKAFVAVDE